MTECRSKPKGLSLVPPICTHVCTCTFPSIMAAILPTLLLPALTLQDTGHGKFLCFRISSSSRSLTSATIGMFVDALGFLPASSHYCYCSFSQPWRSRIINPMYIVPLACWTFNLQPSTPPLTNSPPCHRLYSRTLCPDPQCHVPEHLTQHTTNSAIPPQQKGLGTARRTPRSLNFCVCVCVCVMLC